MLSKSGSTLSTIPMRITSRSSAPIRTPNVARGSVVRSAAALEDGVELRAASGVGPGCGPGLETVSGPGVTVEAEFMMGSANETTGPVGSVYVAVEMVGSPRGAPGAGATGAPFSRLGLEARIIV